MTRIQLSRKKGFKLPEGAVKIDRSTKWGNPYIIGVDGTREEVVEKFRNDTLLIAANIRRNFAGVKYVACWCKENEICHGDVYCEIVNGGVRLI